MSERDDNAPSVYLIPENFIGESRVFGGRIRTRYLIDSIALSLIFGLVITLPLVIFALKGMAFNVKISIIVMTIAPGFLIGQIGYNGDPISVFILNFFSWRKQRQVRLYNETPRLLGTDPVKAISEENRGMDKFVTFVQNRQQKKIDKKNAESYVEGETFEFQYDPGIDGYTEDNGDYAGEDLENSEYWAPVNISIASGGDLGGLESLLCNDGYNEPPDTEIASYASYVASDGDLEDDEEEEESKNG